MQAVIMHPEGVDAGLASEAARQHLDVAPENVEQVIARSEAQTSVERLAIYADAYFARLLECLGEEFPILRKTLGEETFDAFAFDYLQRYPSQSYTLGKLGEKFARYLAETRPEEADDELPNEWPEFLIDLATLEWTFNQVFDGPGVEGQMLLTSEQLERIDAEQWPAARLEMVPCFKLLALRFPVNAFYTAMRRDENPELPAPAPSWLAITPPRIHRPPARTQPTAIRAAHGPRRRRTDRRRHRTRRRHPRRRPRTIHPRPRRLVPRLGSEWVFSRSCRGWIQRWKLTIEPKTRCVSQTEENRHGECRLD